MIGDGPDRPSAERAVRQLGLAAWVDFLGNVSPVEGVLGAGDVFLLPSQEESFGLAALEAMACGVPVVASAVGGLPEVVVQGQGGFLFPLGDVQAMAQKVLELLQQPQELARQKALARARAQAFAQDQVVSRYEALYHSLLSPSPRP
jgi:glycosyltransferase involved in cell wall biosynthesis